MSGFLDMSLAPAISRLRQAVAPVSDPLRVTARIREVLEADRTITPDIFPLLRLICN